jgi:hypothetical protein
MGVASGQYTHVHYLDITMNKYTCLARLQAKRG